jgi:hypothetical protein
MGSVYKMDLNKEIKKLANVMGTNKLLEHELSGYLEGDKHANHSEKTKYWKGCSSHNVKQKTKLAYIDQGTGGKLLVQTCDVSMKQKGAYPKGSVFSIKAYGKKNRYLGDVKKVLAQENARQNKLKGMVFERSMRKRKKK